MRHLLLALTLAIVPLSSNAQMRIDVSGVGATQYPIAIANFASDGRAPQQIADIVRSDLARSGAFRVIDPQVTLADNATPDYAAMRTRGADAVLGGSISRLADGRYDIRYRLGDAVRQNVLGGESLVVTESDLRYGAHRVADWVFEKITGEKGIFSTRIAFVSKQGNRYRLNVADWDGENVVSPLTSPESIISPSWSPDGTRLAYVSFESRKPVVYVHTLTTGKRQAVANYKGSNSAPAWSPDSRSLAVALTRDGLSQIYLVNADGSGQPRRITSSPGIDTEPAFSADGKSIYFTSDRGGSPQIYRMNADGSGIARVTFGSSYNVSPRLSPDGKLLAYLTRRDGRYLVAVRDLTGAGTETILSETGSEESPSFSPNGRWVMFATHMGGHDSLVAVTVDGRVRQRLTGAGDIREPTWGPFSK